MGRERGTGQETRAVLSTAAVVKGLPHHFKQTSDLKVLTETEREALARESRGRDAGAVLLGGGKALQIIRDGRLYRATHDTFEKYLEARWGMKRANANKLIKAWPVAQAVFENKSNALAHAGAKALLAFRSALELVPAAEKHGIEAATEVWGMVLEVSPSRPRTWSGRLFRRSRRSSRSTPSASGR
ncbi:hypothetical protein [Kitasatospora fiedleri]|uniref:hypothetical protein n=1 Tax=Kitasatospora fiedleri TaxID=2991545 RepID=UPI00249B4B31|nr:hypothetical protein [Kitasatospora fiedleri]